MAAIDFGVPFLPAKALDIDNREPEHFDLVEGLLDGFELRRLNNGKDEFHDRCSARRLR
jgi:hypothetical protein